MLGDWTIKEMCLSTDSGSDALSAVCPGASISLSPFNATGTVSFKADNTMTSSGVVSFQEFVHFPSTCFTQAQCTAYESQVAAVASITESHCSYDSATGCACTVSSSQSVMSSGTYQVEGSNLTVTSDTNSTPEVDSFCVAGNTLSIYGTSSSGVASAIVLTR